MCTSSKLVICLGVLLSATVAAQRPQLTLPARLTAFAVSAGGATTSAVASQFEITIDRWSTTAETQRLMTVLKDKGADALLESLRDQRSVGSIRTPGNLAYDLRFASTEPGEDGGHRIFLATDRPISFWEAVNRPRTIDYYSRSLNCV